MTKKGLMIGLAIVSVSLVATAVFFPTLPAQVPTNWNAQGQADDYSSKWTLFFLGPGILAASLGILSVIPWLSPRNFAVDTFRSTYVYIVLVILAFLAYFYVVLLWGVWAGKHDFTISIWGGICLLFGLLANVMGKVRRNFWFGVRTPWTLASERVWYATHRFTAKLRVGAALASFILCLIGTRFWIAVAVLVAGAFIPMFYSLICYKQLERRGEV